MTDDITSIRAWVALAFAGLLVAGWLATLTRGGR